MQLYINGNQLVSHPLQYSSVDALAFKRGDTENLSIYFTENYAISPTVSGRNIVFGVKPKGLYDSHAFIVYASSSLIEGDHYLLTPNFNTAELNTLLNVDSLSTNDLASVELMGEISWSDDLENWESSNTFTVTVLNDVIKNTEFVLPNIIPLVTVPVNETYASGWGILDITPEEALGDYLTIGSDTWYFKDSPSAAFEVAIEASDASTLTNLVVSININNTQSLSAWNDFTNFYISSLVPGTAGNLLMVQGGNEDRGLSGFVVWSDLNGLEGGIDATSGTAGSMIIGESLLYVKNKSGVWKSLTLDSL